MELYDRVMTAKQDCVRHFGDFKPELAIILGTGLGAVATLIKDASTLPYAEIEGFPRTTLEGHAGRLVAGTLGGKRVLAMDGRFHYYEGNSLEQVTIPVRLAKAMGAPRLIVSNAAGGLNPQYRAGDIVLIEDHINLMGVNPLIGPNDDRLGARFPDMIEPYSHRLIELAEKVALENAIRTHRGVYLAVTGPNLETRAEYRFMRMIGADLVGMSTVPEVIVAVHAGLEVLGLSVVTDMCLPDALKPIQIEHIIRTAMSAEPKLLAIVRETVARM